MPAVNGFVTVAPDAQYGDSVTAFLSSEAGAAKYVAGGTGTQVVSEIGFWGSEADAAASVNVQLAIFEHDAVNDCPGALVTNSQTPAIAVTGGVEQLYAHTYGTQPEVTGGSTYWIACTQGATIMYYRFATGGVAVYRAASYGTFPTESEWETHSDMTRDFSFYAVYAAAGGASVLPVIQAHYRQRRS